ncbi:MAG: rod shape-determining protein MreC [Candidatus Binataceae bacterium]
MPAARGKITGTFLWRNRVVLTAGALLLISLHLLTGSLSRVDYAAAPAFAMLEIMRPVQAAGAHLGDGASAIIHNYLDLVDVREENTRLRAQIAELKGEDARVTELQTENQHLAGLLELRDALGMNAVAASVIGSDATGLSHTLVLGQGSSSGLRPGMPVLSNRGVVGRIIDTSQNAARVLLIDDHNSALDGFDERSRARGIVAGVVDDGIIMKYVDRSEDLKPGDTIVTSGLDGIFPRVLLVGTVGSVHREGPGLFLLVQVRPAVDFHALEQVLIVTQQAPPPPPDIRG